MTISKIPVLDGSDFLLPCLDLAFRVLKVRYELN